MPIKAKIDMEKFRRDLNRELTRYRKEGVEGLPDKDRQGIGEDMIEAMKDLISKGISPVQGWGRFPAYKAVARGQKIIKSASTDRRITTKAGRAARRALGRSVQSKGYPYNVVHKYPDKRVRPVNLRLSGKFLDRWLIAKSTARGLAVGFWNSKAVSMEDGHRTGWNGQPMRPIIPKEGETFTRVVYQRLLQSARFRMLAWLETYSKRRK